MNKTKAIQISDDVREALKAIEQKHGVKFARGNGKFTKTSLSFGVTFSEVAEDGVVKTPDRTALENLFPHLVDKKLYDGKKVIGYASSSYKYPFVLMGLDGKRYKASKEHVLQAVKA